MAYVDPGIKLIVKTTPRGDVPVLVPISNPGIVLDPPPNKSAYDCSVDFGRRDFLSDAGKIIFGMALCGAGAGIMTGCIAPRNGVQAKNEQRIDTFFASLGPYGSVNFRYAFNDKGLMVPSHDRMDTLTLFLDDVKSGNGNQQAIIRVMNNKGVPIKTATLHPGESIELVWDVHGGSRTMWLRLKEVTADASNRQGATFETYRL